MKRPSRDTAGVQLRLAATDYDECDKGQWMYANEREQLNQQPKADKKAGKAHAAFDRGWSGNSN